MADPTVFSNGYVAWTTSTGGSSYTEIPDVKAIQMPLSRAELANAVMGDTAEVFHPGIISAPITVRTRQAFGASSVDAESFSRWNNRTAFKLKIRAVDSAVSTSNPTYMFSKAFVTSITPIVGDHGALLENELQIRLGSTCALTRSTST